MKHLFVWFGILLAIFLVGCSGGDDAVPANSSASTSVQLIELGVANDGRSNAVLKDGTYVYVTDLDQGLRVFQLEGDSLVQIASLDLQLPAPDPHTRPSWSLAKAGDYLYIAAQTPELIVVNVAIPSVPVLASRVANYSLNNASSVLIKGGKLFLCDTFSFKFFSLANPEMPTELAVYDPFVDSSLPISIDGAAISGDYAYVVSQGGIGYNGMLLFLDISSATKIRFVGKYPTGHMMSSATTYGGFMLAGTVEGGLNILDSQAVDPQHVVTAVMPTSPQATRIAGASTPYQAVYQIVVQGHYAFLADGNNGITVVDLSDVAKPKVIGWADTGGQVTGVAVDGDLLVATDDTTGVHLFRIQEVVPASANNRIVEMVTDHGTIRLELFEDLTPLTTKNFIRLAQRGFYDNLIFHRVIAGFMDQTGSRVISGYPGEDVDYQILDEFPTDASGNLLLKFDQPGILAMANTGVANSGGSQFFITTLADYHDDGDGNYTIFGHVVDGMDVVHAINEVPTTGDTGDLATSYRPIDPVVMERVTIIAE